jgi:hypothetical protein
MSEEQNIEAAAGALLAEIRKAGGLVWDAALQAYYLKGSPIPERRLIKHLWERGSLHFDTGPVLIARDAE